MYGVVQNPLAWTSSSDDEERGENTEEEGDGGQGGCGYRKYDRGQQKPVQRLSDPIEENGYVEANDN